MNKLKTVKPIKSIVRFLTIFAILLPAISQAQQSCDCNTQISLIYPDCVISNESFDLIYYLYDFEGEIDDAINKIELVDNLGNIISTQDYQLGISGGYANSFKLSVNMDVDYSIRYYCKSNVCYKSDFLPIRL